MSLTWEGKVRLVWEGEDGSWLEAQKAPRRAGEGGRADASWVEVLDIFVLSLSEWKGFLRAVTEGGTSVGLERIKQWGEKCVLYFNRRLPGTHWRYSSRWQALRVWEPPGNTEGEYLPQQTGREPWAPHIQLLLPDTEPKETKISSLLSCDLTLLNVKFLSLVFIYI